MAITPNFREDFSSLYQEDELGTRICPCIEIIAFTDARLADGPHQGLLNFYEAFRKQFGTQIKWYQTADDDHFKKVTPVKLDMVPFWFSDPRSKNEGLLGVNFKSGSQPTDMQVPGFRFYCDQLLAQPSGVFHMVLPLNAGFENLQGILPLINEALKDFPLTSGYVGYTVYWDTLDFRFGKRVYNPNMPRVHMRHPGIGLARPTYLHLLSSDGGLVGVSWLTLIGSKLLKDLGGYVRLTQNLQAPIESYPLPCQDGGILIAAGPKPLVGDLAEGDALPLYKKVGHAVREARRKMPFYETGFSNEDAEKWFMRFFGE